MPAKTDQAVIDEVIHLYHIKAKSVSQIAEATGLHPRAVSRVVHKYGEPHESKPYRLPRFDGWDFIHENVEVGRA